MHFKLYNKIFSKCPEDISEPAQLKFFINILFSQAGSPTQTLCR